MGEFSPDWFARARAKRAAILADIAPHVADSDSAAVMKYTMGTGGAGIDSLDRPVVKLVLELRITRAIQ